jgi:hypothetical protein
MSLNFGFTMFLNSRYTLFGDALRTIRSFVHAYRAGRAGGGTRYRS